MLFQLFQLIYQKIRLKNPWNFKIPLLISLPYFVIAVCNIPPVTALLGLLAAFSTVLGIAGFAYFINDLTDIKQDQLAGRKNVTAELTWVQNGLLLCLFLAVALLPWFYLPLGRVTSSLLVIEFALFILYSMPPFRFKERGVLGILTDALYAHTIPAILAVLTFAMMSPHSNPDLAPFLIGLGLWQFNLGLRNMVLHQLSDYSDDVKSATQTLATQMGAARVQRFLTYVIAPLEIFAFGFFALVFSAHIGFFIPAYVGYLVLTTCKLRYLWKQQLPSTVRDCLYKYFDDFYIEWIPVIILVHLVIHTPTLWPLFILHLLLFRNGIHQWGRELSHHIGLTLTARQTAHR